jgi:hypothetical protein
MTKMKKFLLVLLVTGFTLVAIFPGAVGFPTKIGPPDNALDVRVFTWVSVFFIVTLTGVMAARIADSKKINLLMTVGRLAIVSLLSSLFMWLDVNDPFIELPTPHFIARVFLMDGQFAYEADVFEIYCEIWITIMFIILSIIFLVRIFRRQILL